MTLRNSFKYRDTNIQEEEVLKLRREARNKEREREREREKESTT